MDSQDPKKSPPIALISLLSSSSHLLNPEGHDAAQERVSQASSASVPVQTKISSSPLIFSDTPISRKGTRNRDRLKGTGHSTWPAACSHEA
jgi:hypothetical protein